jgi:hypothetical protein
MRLQRITLEEALEHPWVRQEVKGAENEDDKRLDLNVVSRLQRYSTYGAFKQQAMVTILKQRRKISINQVDGVDASVRTSKKAASKSKLDHFVSHPPSSVCSLSSVVCCTCIARAS